MAESCQLACYRTGIGLAGEIDRLRDRIEQLGQSILSCIKEARLGDGTIAMVLCPDAIAQELKLPRDDPSPDVLHLRLPFQQRRRGVEARLVIGAARPARDDILIANIARAEQWRAALLNGDDLATIAAREGITVKYLGEMLPFAFLSPKLVRAILEGHQPSGLTTNWLRRHGLPASWAEQDRILAQL